MRVMVIGSGGREHALVRYLLRSPSVSQVAAFPGSDAIAAEGARCFPGSMDDSEAMAAAARQAADLVVFGPEAPLAAGMADRLRQDGLAVFGPGMDGARLESSKAWAKEFMRRHNLPTASAQVFSDYAAAAGYIQSCPQPPVIKVDGLAAGKGVTVAKSNTEALEAARRALVDGAFGASGRRIVVEERLQGFEVSVLVLVDGQDYLILPPLQDHKAVFDGGLGPNTGGMGAYSPVPAIEDRLYEIEEKVVKPAIAGLQKDNIDYRGVLYVGLMVTPAGPKILEFNCRFGDPEAQALLPRLEGDLGSVLWAVANGKLAEASLSVRSEAAVCVILASSGYPGDFETGFTISGLEEAGKLPGVSVFHSGTRWEGGQWKTAGGRVLGVTALGENLAQARRRAYEACSLINFTGCHYRRDVALSAI